MRANGKIDCGAEERLGGRPLWRLFAAILIAFFSLPGSAFSREAEAWNAWRDRAGPIPLVNQSPIQLLFLQPVPDRAEIIPAGHGSVRINNTLTNTLLSESSDTVSATFDLEAIRNALDIRYGLTPRLEMGLSLPLAHYDSGFLDHSIQDVEEAFGAERSIRANQQANKFTYSVTKDGKTVVSGSEGATGLGDLVLTAKAGLLEQATYFPAVSARASVKAPTGAKDRALGSGELDWGAGLLFEKGLGPLNLYLNGDVTFPGEAFEDVGLDVHEFYTVMAGAEYGIGAHWAVLAQFNYLTRPFDHVGVRSLDQKIYEVLAGVNYRTKGNLFFQAGGVEDIIDSADASADFTFFFNLGLYF